MYTSYDHWRVEKWENNEEWLLQRVHESIFKEWKGKSKSFWFIILGLAGSGAASGEKLDTNHTQSM